MAQRLFIFCDAEAQPQRWMALDAGGQCSARGLGVPAPDLREAASSLSLFLPGTELPLYRVEIPVRNRAAAQKAVPYALEDQIAGDVELLHFVLPRQLPAGPLTATAVSRERLDAWLAHWTGLGLYPDHLYSALELLPVDPKQNQLLLVDDVAMLALSDGRRLALDVDMLDLFWASLPAEAEPGQVSDARSKPGDPCWPATWTHQRRSAEELLLACLSSLSPHQACDLLQNEYAPRRQQVDRAAWRPVAALAAAVLVAVALWLAVDFHQLGKEQRLLDTEIERLFFVALPEATRYTAPQERVSAELQRLRGGGGDGVFDVLRRVAPILSATPSARLDSLAWRDGVLEIGASGPDVRSLDGLRESLSTAPGVQVELLSATPRDARIDGRLRVTVRTP